MTDVLGVQLTPWGNARELVDLGSRLKSVFDVVWVQDQMLARNAYALLGALANAGCGVGTGVTYPIGRNPIEMASAVATIAELVPAGREVVVGMGTGGAVVQSLFLRDRPVSAVAEAITLMRALWAGETVDLDRFPVLGRGLGYKPGAMARLTYAVERPPCIAVTGVGPKILKVAGTHADGLIFASNMPTHSYPAFRSGRFAELSGLSVARAARAADAPPLRLIFGINVSISADRERARFFARRQLALVLGNPRLWPDLEAVGLDVESANDVKAAFDAGHGIEGAAARISSTLAEALIVSGTPEDCVERMVELRQLAEAEGYSEFYVGGPLGPDVFETAELLRDIVVPQVWPEHASVPR
ncbi:MAG TPA: LLM class flavin-dependent oxidoreductase [Pseudonocardiaceae bacterium]|nr:LLM class flavin-dependent oxidoreductase [Pseudonocardiaceae bacterium]